MLPCLRKLFFTILTVGLAATAFLVTGDGLTAAENDSGQVSPVAMAETLQEFYHGLNSLTFDFSQVTSTGGRERTGSGSAVFYKGPTARPEPDRNGGADATVSIMRWNYTEPDRQVIINDGETLSIYTEKDRQLIRTPAGELESDITYAFFAGTRTLLDDFAAQAADDQVTASSIEGLLTILLVPRQPHNQLKSVQVWFDGEYIIHHLRIEDHFEATTELHFDNIALNSLPPRDMEQMNRIISLQVPPDTEIIIR